MKLLIAIITFLGLSMNAMASGMGDGQVCDTKNASALFDNSNPYSSNKSNTDDASN